MCIRDSDITKEYDITTVINTHDMNSVMGIGERINFIKEGELEWQGSSKDVTVSYTHLDVYKRQPIQMPMLRKMIEAIAKL